ncbi:hypothetical protein MW887_002556 [Aspergillus wentii]|nr:hypothetical protein MW887_002556 [Aspergillus wentii]
MSHPLVAAVWEQLGRHDVANILREVIGEYATELATLHVKSGPTSDIESTTRMVFWIKAIFDLQRTYLQGMSGMRDCHPYLLPYLLPSETIFSTLMYLIRVKSELFPISMATTPEFAEHRYSIAQTLLAGVRLLVLRGENLHTHMKVNLEQAIRAAWQHPGLSSGESYLVNDFLPSAIGFIGYPDISGSPQSPAAKACLPPFVSGIYPFSITPETLITDTLTALVGSNGEQMGPFWTLYDILWAAEAALIQCHVDRRRFAQDQGYSSKAAVKVEEAFVQAGETRKKLARTILMASDGQSDSPSLQVLATMILSQNANGAPPLQTRRTREAWVNFSHIRTALDNSLGLFVRWLINRRVQLWDCNGELEAVSREYQQHLTQWLHNSSSTETGNQTNEPERRGSVVYVVNCPAVHPVPRDLLEEQLRGGDRAAYEQLQESSPFITMDVSCPLCPGDSRIQNARMIEPLEQLSNALHFVSESESSISRHSFLESVSRNTTSRSSSLSRSTGRSSTPLESSDNSKSPTSPITPSPGSMRIGSRLSFSMAPEGISTVLANTSEQLREKQTIKSLSRELKNVKMSFSGRRSSLRRSLSKEQRLPHQPRFVFSSTGKTLLLWGANSNWVMRFEVPSIVEGRKPQGHRYDVSGVQNVAVGDQRCAIVASVGEHLELLVFGSTGSTAEAYLTIDIPQRTPSITSMTMSRDDEYVAFTLGDQFHVYRLGANMIKKVILADQIGPE